MSSPTAGRHADPSINTSTAARATSSKRQPVGRGEFTTAGAVAAVERSDSVAAVGSFRRHWSNILRASDFRAGCPITSAALEGWHEPSARDIAGGVFADWQDVIADALRNRGVAARRAHSIATLLLASLEGAIILCRAERSLRPLERVSDELELELELVMASALESGAAGQRRNPGRRSIGPVFVEKTPSRHHALRGRDERLTSLSVMLDRVRGGAAGAVMLVEGGAGMGKTRLLEARRFRADASAHNQTPVVRLRRGPAKTSRDQVTSRRP
ncbi:MAG TPA: hypothetical protein VH231_14765 [Solirubrobacteraceae bacterium]|jgi:hypothetical protein|nr:hypothetical protein [Solirubrobacteraceae bacterium]